MKPGCFKIGNTGGMLDNILASKLYRPGRYDLVSPVFDRVTSCFASHIFLLALLPVWPLNSTDLAGMIWFHLSLIRSPAALQGIFLFT